MQDELTDIKEIQRLELRTDDIIVVRYAMKLTTETRNRLMDGLREYLGVPNKIVILDYGARIDILAPTDEPVSDGQRNVDQIAEAMRQAKESSGRVVGLAE